ncbi:ABC transporter ATP-binding protein [Synechococcus sp. M16CYN]|uniref:ABC transporter ATP-binding protein n=1 Tax=Synechococcus sp. M16CYN TaxID=3103139 RepID=UPI00324B92D3
MAMIELRQLSKTYGAVSALSNLDMTVPEACLYGLLGPNGAGKTTVLRILTTLLSPDSGSVHVAGVDALQNPKEVRCLLGYVAQEVAIDKVLSGRELLQFQGDIYHLKRRDRDYQIDALIDRLNMKPWIDRRCGTYSGGMRRRLDLAAGLLHRPRLLVLDEPTVGLDIESRSVIWQLLNQLVEDGTSVLLSSHYLEEIEALADRIAIIDAGTVIAEGTPAALKQCLGGDRVTLRIREFSDAQEAARVCAILKSVEGVRQVVINRAQGFSLNLVIEGELVIERLRHSLNSAGISIFALTQSRPSLDDVYLQATGCTLMDAELAIAGQRDIKQEKRQSM